MAVIDVAELQRQLRDAVVVETPGLAADFFFRDTATGAVDQSVSAAANLDYDSTGSNALPANATTAGDPISGIWRRLLAGEALHLDVKRMEMAYLENNKREIELTRHISLRQLDPLALLALHATGSCTVTVPEWLYDLDCPGHYL